MRVHYFQHDNFEGLGSIETWIEKNGYESSGTQFFDSYTLPDLNNIDLLIIMGGPMSVNDETRFPWLVEEKRFIKQVISAGKPVLGICLGAQLIANVMGAKVYPNKVKEIGWFPIESVLEPGFSGEYFIFPTKMTAFHWHGETFDLPKGAIHLACSKACENQGFQLGSNVIGLQFHLETTLETAKLLVSHGCNELVTGEFIQTEKQIFDVSPEKIRKNNEYMEKILDFLAAKVKFRLS